MSSCSWEMVRLGGEAGNGGLGAVMLRLGELGGSKARNGGAGVRAAGSSQARALLLAALEPGAMGGWKVCLLESGERAVRGGL